MPGGKGKTGGKTGGKGDAGVKTSKSHSAKAGLQVREISGYRHSVVMRASWLLSFRFNASPIITTLKGTKGLY